MSLPGKFVEVAGVRIFVHRPAPSTPAAPRPPLLLIHGYLVSHWEWRAMLAPLAAAGFDVIALDLPGHGESDRPRDFTYGVAGFSEIVIGVMDALGIEKAPLFGHSMGGAIALYTAARNPERVPCLVVLDAACYPIALSLQNRLAVTPIIGPLLFKGVFGKRDIKNYFRDQVYRDPALATDELVDYIYERMCRPGGKDALHATLVSLSNLGEVERSLRAIRCPTLVIWGENERLFPVENGRRMASEIPGAELVVIPDCGHAGNEERPAEVLAAVLPFLNLR